MTASRWTGAMLVALLAGCGDSPKEKPTGGGDAAGRAKPDADAPSKKDLMASGAAAAREPELGPTTRSALVIDVLELGTDTFKARLGTFAERAISLAAASHLPAGYERGMVPTDERLADEQRATDELPARYAARRMSALTAITDFAPLAGDGAALIGAYREAIALQARFAKLTLPDARKVMEAWVMLGGDRNEAADVYWKATLESTPAARRAEIPEWYRKYPANLPAWWPTER